MVRRTVVLQKFERYLKKKKRKIGNSAHGYERGQRDLIIQILKSAKKTQENKPFEVILA